MNAGAKKVLVVDDEESIVELLDFNLRREGYLVRTAYDGEGAISAAEADVPDLILLDFMLPGMDGLTVLGHLRQGAATRQVPIVMVTAFRESSLIFEAAGRGATDVLFKPLSIRDLMRRVEGWLSAGGLGRTTGTQGHEALANGYWREWRERDA